MTDMTFEKLVNYYGPTIAYLGDKELPADITIAGLAEELTHGATVFAQSHVTEELGEEMQAAADILTNAADLPDGSPELPRLLKQASDHLDMVKALA